MPADGGVQDCSANLNDPDKPVLEEISTRLAVQTSLLSKIETKQTAQKVLSDGNVKHTETRYDISSDESQRSLGTVDRSALTRLPMGYGEEEKVYDSSGNQIVVNEANIPVLSCADFSFDRIHCAPPIAKYSYQWNYPRMIRPLAYHSRQLSDDERHTYVGDLWQVPDDHRLSLTVSTNGLARYFTQSNDIYHLQSCQNFLNSLNLTPEWPNPTPLLKIYDTDEYGHQHCYGSNPGSSDSSRSLIRTPDVIWATSLEHRYGLDLRRVYPQGSSPAPWRRIIHIMGLSHASLGAGGAIPLFYDEGHANFGEWQFSGAVKLHLSCADHIDATYDATTAMPRFHIQWYVLPKGWGRMLEHRKSTWKSGRLYHDGRHLSRCCCTIQALYGHNNVFQVWGSQPLIRYWTLVVLDPLLRDWDGGILNHELFKDGVFSKALSLQTALLKVIVGVLMRIATHWAELSSELSSFLDHDSFLDSDKHDSLLCDDAGYSMSRKYFWYISTLQAFETNIAQNINYWQTFRDAFYTPLLEGIKHKVPIGSRSESEHSEWPNFQEEIKLLASGIAEADTACNAFGAADLRLKNMRDVATAMRDGLLNATSLAEARSATQLAENVKLLTYASIFFLPLSFCMAVWSINNMLFSLKALIYVAISVAVGTYLAVYNIDGLVCFFKLTITATHNSLRNWLPLMRWCENCVELLDQLGNRYWKLPYKLREIIRLAKLCMTWPRSFIQNWRQKWKPHHDDPPERYPDPWTTWAGEEEAPSGPTPRAEELQASSRAEPWIEQSGPSSGPQPWIEETGSPCWQEPWVEQTGQWNSASGSLRNTGGSQGPSIALGQYTKPPAQTRPCWAREPGPSTEALPEPSTEAKPDPPREVNISQEPSVAWGGATEPSSQQSLPQVW